MLAAFNAGLSSHRVNWATYGQVMPSIGITITTSSDEKEQLTVQLLSTAFEAEALTMRAEGITRLAFPQPVRR